MELRSSLALGAGGKVSKGKLRKWGFLQCSL